MTDTTRTAILRAVSALFFSDRIHDTFECDCMGCPFRSHYIDNPTNNDADGAYYHGLCETEQLWWGCAKWEDDMGEDL